MVLERDKNGNIIELELEEAKEQEKKDYTLLLGISFLILGIIATIILGVFVYSLF